MCGGIGAVEGGDDREGDGGDNVMVPSHAPAEDDDVLVLFGGGGGAAWEGYESDCAVATGSSYYNVLLEEGVGEGSEEAFISIIVARLRRGVEI